MRLIELHILQSFPVSCLNRDDVGAPKTATFGGVTRARISSQCLKRAIRERAREEQGGKGGFAGVRTKLLAPMIRGALVERHGVAADRALEMACAVAGVFNKKEGKPLRTDDPELETLFFASPHQVTALAELAFKEFGAGGEIKADKRKFVKACVDVGVVDAADIALFGRMVAADSSLTLEGAALFSHALSTHRADNDIDFFSAVDERKDKSADAGAGMLGTLEFASATYYRYVGLNLDLLADKNHLAQMEQEPRKSVVEAFLRACIGAVPGARKNSMNADTLPGYVLGIAKDKGHPLQLVNAFEDPVRPDHGLLGPSVRNLLLHLHRLKTEFNLAPQEEKAVGFHQVDAGKEGELKRELIPEQVNLNAFCHEMVKHVC